MSLSKLIKATKAALPVTQVHEQYLARSSNVRVSEQVAQFVVSELTSPQRERRWTFSASARGTCQRQQVLKRLGYPGKEGFTTDQSAIFHHGTWVHLKWQAMGLDAGWLKEVEVPCRIDEYNVTGTIDGLLDPSCTGGVDMGWELKSINSRGFRIVNESGPLLKHLLQVHCYMLATGIKAWSIVYEEKDSQQWKEFVVPEDPDLREQVILELKAVNAAYEMQKLPPMKSRCEEEEGVEFRSCPFRKTCPHMKEWPTMKGVRL